MNTNIKIFLLCPVPEDQKPINAYIGLKENQLTNWTTLSKKNYEKKLTSLFFFFFVLVSFFRFFTLGPSDLGIDSQSLDFSAWFKLEYAAIWPSFFFLFEWSLVTVVTSLTCLFFLLLVIFSRWKQIEKDFNEPRLFYEEASWYDGQVWEKPFSILKNDKLISTQKIKPILERISRTIFTVLSWNLALLMFWIIPS